MNNGTNLDDLNNYSSKTMVRAKVKETFTELSSAIFGYVDELGTIDAEKFEAISSFHSIFYNEYCSQLKAFFETTNVGMKKSAKDMYFTYQEKTYKLTQQGLTAKAPVTITTCNVEDVPLKQSVHDVEKACIKLRFNQ